MEVAAGLTNGHKNRWILRDWMRSGAHELVFGKKGLFLLCVPEYRKQLASVHIMVITGRIIILLDAVGPRVSKKVA